MNQYPLKFKPVYKEKIWGGRNLERLFSRALPPGKKIGESWELADLKEDAGIVANGPEAGKTLTELMRQWGGGLLGGAVAMPDGRFPLLLKLLDANDILSLQVHPDAEQVAAIGAGAAPKTECWYILESRGGFIYKGVQPGVGRKQFAEAIEADDAEAIKRLVQRIDVAAGDFHYLPAGTVHALGAGVVVAEVQTPSDTTYRVTDWGRGREIHVERSMQCIHFTPADDTAPGAMGETLLVTEFFTVTRRSLEAGQATGEPKGRCAAMMFLAGDAKVSHGGAVEPVVRVRAGDTVLLPAGLDAPTILACGDCTWLEITLAES
ncbi:MAG: type I phosphomannose isomerase catalytic subunit [Planctomycetota bacterium]|nr:type I phosphomannose isomerase catalytic subunit [Planctomycetota bacterium]